MFRTALCAMTVVVVSLSAQQAGADDLYPPEWRGQPGTTFQQWEFLSNNPTPPPDLVNNPYGMPELHVWPGVGQAWWSMWGGREGVWPLSGTIEVTIPNAPPPNPFKEIWVQLTWAPQAPGTMPIVGTIFPQVVGAELVRQVALGPTNEPYPAGSSWYHSVYKMTLIPNPAYEIIKIDGAVMVDELVVDTICAVPTPAAAWAGGVLLAGLGLVRFWRRK